LVSQAQIKCWLANQPNAVQKKEEIGDAESWNFAAIAQRLVKKNFLANEKHRACSQRFACKRIRDSSELSSLCQDKTFFVKKDIQFTENQRN
jgi:hypothetical protein